MRHESYLFHVTPLRNLPHIRRHGLKPFPEKPLGTPVVWLCEHDTLLWAIGHVSNHQRCEIRRMVVVEVDTNGLALVPHGGKVPGIFKHHSTISYVRLLRAENAEVVISDWFPSATC